MSEMHKKVNYAKDFEDIQLQISLQQHLHTQPAIT